MTGMHPEDVKAQLRKQFGSVFQFEDAFRLPRKSVSDFLRGRANKRVGDAIQRALENDSVGSSADLSDSSAGFADAHRQSAGAR
jgi:hypothetical protein